jgi:hypothetical protein
MRRLRIILTPALALLLSVSLTSAQGGYDLSWWTVDGGGYAFSIGGDYTLGGTIGQPDAGLMTGSDYTLGGGFWGGGEVAEAEAYNVYLPLILRQ